MSARHDSKNRPPGRSTLLIVDDDPRIVRAAARSLLLHFDRVVTAACPEEADHILEMHSISHLLCDLKLENRDGEPVSGFDCAEKWRNHHPELRRIVVFTGAPVRDIAVPPWVDELVPKTAGLTRIAAVLHEKSARDAG